MGPKLLEGGVVGTKRKVDGQQSYEKHGNLKLYRKRKRQKGNGPSLNWQKFKWERKRKGYGHNILKHCHNFV